VLTKLGLDLLGVPDYALDLPKLRGTDSVTSVDLSHKHLGHASAIVIASLITGNGVLTWLDLANNHIGFDGFRNHIVPEASKAIGAALRANKVLTTLNIQANSIGDEGAKALASALRVNGVLTDLNLGRNQIRDEGAAAIAEALRGNAVLKSLNLRYNGIDALVTRRLLRHGRDRVEIDEPDEPDVCCSVC